MVYGFDEARLLAETGDHPKNPTMRLASRMVLGYSQKPIEVVVELSRFCSGQALISIGVAFEGKPLAQCRRGRRATISLKRSAALTKGRELCTAWPAAVWNKRVEVAFVRP